MRWIVAAALLLGGCYVPAEPYVMQPESEAWRTAPPIGLPPPVMEREWKDKDGIMRSECIDAKSLQPIRCFDEV